VRLGYANAVLLTMRSEEIQTGVGSGIRGALEGGGMRRRVGMVKECVSCTLVNITSLRACVVEASATKTRRSFSVSHSRARILI